MKPPSTNTDGNEWIHGYLEAILDVGATIGEKHRPKDVFKQRGSDIENRRSQIAIGQRGAFNPSKFFVEEVISVYDETDIYRTWVKTIAMRNTQERNNRMENLCWRIWHLTRRKRKIQREYANRSAQRHVERERGRRDMRKELSEFSDGEPGSKAKAAGPKLSRNYSDFQMFIQQQPQKKKSLYMVLISLHGLVRGYNMELGRDSDTGGQVKYVVELARALAMMPEVYRVDLLTRQICSPAVDWSYGEPTEMLTPEELQDAGESSGAYIVRIPCGPREKYISKEHLWPYIQEFVDGALVHILNMARVLGEQINAGQIPTHVMPHVIHGHYADAGNIAALLSGILNVPMVLTGHSLGRNKLEQLLKQGRQSKEDINRAYRIMRRIEAEELSLDAAELVITSTRQEIEEQWGLYDGFDVFLERKLRVRVGQGMNCHGLCMPRMVVIPPGMDFSNVASPDAGEMADGDIDPGVLSSDPMSPTSEPQIWGEIKRFFSNPHKPIILALARPDPKKNLTTLVNAFGDCQPLKELANLVLIMGNRDDIDEMSAGNASVLTTILKLIDKHNLYGQVAYPKRHKQSDVPNIYRLTARTKGVFINPALVEPFGLTLIEAAAHGVPMVATRNGGPVDIYKALQNGLLVDPNDQNAIAEALLKLVSDRNLWLECRLNGLKNINHYSWPEHCRIYLARIAQCRVRYGQWHNDELLDYQQIDEDFQRDSLKDVHTYLSIDDKALGAGSENFKSPMQQQNGERVMGTVTQKSSETVKQEQVCSTVTNPGRMLLQRKGKSMFVMAVDSYDSHGLPGKKMVTAVHEVIASVQNEPSFQSTGFILATAMTMAETVAFLNFGGLKLHDFDAFICGSGSELYYPDVYADNASIPSNAHFYNDQNYAAHNDYRWSKDGLRKCMDKILSYAGKEPAILEDQTCTNEHCLAYKVKDPSKALRVDDLRKNLRLRGSRCRVLYCKNESRLYILPMRSSRTQALRYLFVRWRTDISNMFVFVGETGDSDYEELLPGMHKTIILKGSVNRGSERLLRGSGSYNKQDTIPLESSNIVATESDFNVDNIKTAYKSFHA